VEQEEQEQEQEEEEVNLSSGVNDFGQELLSTVLDDFGEGVLNCRVVRVHKVILHKLDRQR